MWEKYVVARLKKQMFDTEHVNGFVSKPWCAGWERKSAEYALDGLNTDLDIVSTDCRAKVKKIKLVHLVFLFLSSPVLCHTLWCQRCRWLSRRPPWTQSPPLAPDWTCLMSLGLPLDHQSKWQGWAVNQHTCLSPNIPRATSCLSKHTGRCWLFTVSHNMYCHVHRKCVAPNLNSVLVFFLHVQWKFFPSKSCVCVLCHGRYKDNPFTTGDSFGSRWDSDSGSASFSSSWALEKEEPKETEVTISSIQPIGERFVKTTDIQTYIEFCILLAWHFYIKYQQCRIVTDFKWMVERFVWRVSGCPAEGNRKLLCPSQSPARHGRSLLMLKRSRLTCSLGVRAMLRYRHSSHIPVHLFK